VIDLNFFYIVSLLYFFLTIDPSVVSASGLPTSTVNDYLILTLRFGSEVPAENKESMFSQGARFPGKAAFYFLCT
jgi:hypothetical protein